MQQAGYEYFKYPTFAGDGSSRCTAEFINRIGRNSNQAPGGFVTLCLRHRSFGFGWQPAQAISVRHIYAERRGFKSWICDDKKPREILVDLPWFFIGGETGIYEPIFAPKDVENAVAACAHMHVATRWRRLCEGSNRGSATIKNQGRSLRISLGFLLAERQGFEPWYPVRGNTISSRAP